MECDAPSVVCNLGRIAEALEVGATWFDWLNFAMQTIGTLSTVFVGIVALVLAHRASTAEVRRAERARRVAFAARLRDWAGGQRLQKVVGTWTEMSLIEDGGGELPSLAAAADSPNAENLFAWVFAEISNTETRNLEDEVDADRLITWAKEMDAVIDAWIENPTARLPAVKGARKTPAGHGQSRE